LEEQRIVSFAERKKSIGAVAVYSIKDLEKLSGIKAHTIRIWEQRYHIIQPNRTKTNIRYYQDEDLKFLLNVALLNKNGFKISKIAHMNRMEVAEKVAAISEINFESDTQLDALTLAMIEMDEYKFDRIMTTNIAQIGFERTMLEVIYPFLDKLSILWLTGSINPVQENFMSYLIRQKLIVAIDRAPLPSGRDIRKFVIYLPEGERQELSLLFMHYLLKSRNNQVIYLGQDISLADLKDACKIHRPHYLFTMITESFAKESVQTYVDRLAESFPDAIILLSGYQIAAQPVLPPDNVRLLYSLDQTLSLVS
jgi:DNA-binding transcriptional MerR regulator